MPKISELPEDQPLTGQERIPIVQNGETRQVTLADLLNAPRTISLSSLRWVTCSETADVINDPTIHIVLSSSGAS